MEAPLDSPQVTMVAELAPQLPTWALLALLSMTDENASVVASVFAGKVIVTLLLAACASPPVAEAANPIVYTVRAPAADDGESVALTPVTELCALMSYRCDGACVVSEVVWTSRT